YLVWQVRDEWGQLRYQLRHPEYLLLAIAAAVLAIVVSAWIWRGLIPRNGRPPFGQILALYLQGILWNNVLPGGMGGDVVRAAGLWAGSGQGATAVGSVLMARLAGLWSVVLLAMGAALAAASALGWAEARLLIGGTALILALTAAATFLLFSRPVSALAARLPGRWRSLYEGLRTYGDRPAILLQVLGWSLTVQMCAVAVNALTARALDLPITAGMLLLAVPLVSLSVMVPISIGGFGLREGAYLTFLGLFGVRAGDALVLSLAVFTLLTLVSAAGAALCRLLVAPEKTITA
ncbi:MAG: lysylphosphatidylglycerol synthase transmembrane domain-containing protein, partial [Candidatus Promineifilaceae bacterium]